MARGIRRPRNVNEAIETAKQVPTYTRLVWALARDPRVPIGQKAVLGAIAAYLAFPFDIIPDFIPVIGQLDDLAVLLLGVDWFLRNAPAEVVEEHMTKIAVHQDTLSRDLEAAGALLQGRATVLRATLERMRNRGMDQ